MVVMRLLATAAFTGLYLVLAEQACDAVSEQELLDVEAEEASLADDVQLLQLATSFEKLSTNTMDGDGSEDGPPPPPPAQPELGGDGSERRPDVIFSEEAKTQRRGAIPLEPAESDAYPPGVNETYILQKLREFEKNPSLLELGSNSSRFWGPVTFEYSDGESDENYCRAEDRYTLFSGQHATQEACGIFSCHFYSGSCGYYFYTSATPGTASKAVCRCCKENPRVHKSTVGNKIYQC